MLDLIKQNIEQIAEICRRHGVKRLELFGSAARDDFQQDSSDIDCFYEFDRNDKTSVADRFFGLWEDLEALLGYQVDLVSAKDAKNPYFLEVANRHRITLYAA